MKKIRLTESQLIDLIKKSVNEVKTINESQIISESKTITPESLAEFAKKLQNTMKGSGAFGDVTAATLKQAYNYINAMQDYLWEDGTCAVATCVAQKISRKLREVKKREEKGRRRVFIL
jgi:phage-related protein